MMTMKEAGKEKSKDNEDANPDLGTSRMEVVVFLILCATCLPQLTP